MPDFYVNPPNYRPADYSWLGNLPNQFYQGAQEKQQYDLSHAFSNGVPMNPDGTVNAQALLQIYGKNGDVADIPKLSNMALQQQQLRQSSELSPLLAPGGDGRAPAAPSATAAPSQSAQPANAPRFSGDTVSAIVDSVLPQAAKSGVVARNVARAVGVDPDANLTPEQARKTQSLITGYLTRVGQIAPDSASAPRGIRNNNPGNIEDGNFARSQPGYAGTEAKGRFATFDTPQDGLNAAATLIGRYSKAGINTISGIVNKWAPASDGNNTGNYAAAVAKTLGVDPNQPLDLSSPKTRLAVASAMSDFENGQHSAAQPQGHPITPTVPLPPGYTDPEQAILGIDREIARLGNNPYAKGQLAALEDWRNRIADSVKPIQLSRWSSLVDPRTGQPIAGGEAAGGGEIVTNIAKAIQNGDQPPSLTGLYGLSGPVRAQLEKSGVPLATLQLQYDAAKKQIQSLNGPQMTRFVGLGNSVVNTINEVRDLSRQMQLGGVPAYNQAKLQTYVQAFGNTKGGQLAAKYLAAVNTLKEEFANLANGGYAPHEAAWKLADSQINGNYGVNELGASLDEVQRLIKYRLDAIPGLSTYGPGTQNTYLGGGAKPQAPAEAAPVAPQAPTQSSSSPFRLGQTASNPKTGQKIQWNGTQWVPVSGR